MVINKLNTDDGMYDRRNTNTLDECIRNLNNSYDHSDKLPHSLMHAVNSLKRKNDIQTYFNRLLQLTQKSIKKSGLPSIGEAEPVETQALLRDYDHIRIAILHSDDIDVYTHWTKALPELKTRQGYVPDLVNSFKPGPGIR